MYSYFIKKAWLNVCERESVCVCVCYKTSLFNWPHNKIVLKFRLIRGTFFSQCPHIIDCYLWKNAFHALSLSLYACIYEWENRVFEQVCGNTTMRQNSSRCYKASTFCVMKKLIYRWKDILLYSKEILFPIQSDRISS